MNGHQQRKRVMWPNTVKNKNTTDKSSDCMIAGLTNMEKILVCQNQVVLVIHKHKPQADRMAA